MFSFVAVTCYVFLLQGAFCYLLRGKHGSLKRLAVGNSSEACGVTIASFGDPRGKFVTAAVANVLRIQSMKPGAGWCPLDHSLEHVPVTLITDLPQHVLVDYFGHEMENIALMSNQTFDKVGVDTDSLSPGWWIEGNPIYRWYHCQGLLRSPYDLTLYLDSDATVCGADKFVKLFKAFFDSGADMAFQNSLSPPMWFFGKPLGEAAGFHCTHGDATNPHPAEVASDADIDSWQRTNEPNAGVIFFSKQRDVARKVASEWCSVLESTMRSKDEAMPCDQYALRVSFWKNRKDFKSLIFDADADEICRYGDRHFSGCDRGCDIVHGWSFSEVKALLPEPLRDDFSS
jgi:hypothetical protein